MAVALPLRLPLLDQATLTIAGLQDYMVFRWQAEACPYWIRGCPPSYRKTNGTFGT